MTKSTIQQPLVFDANDHNLLISPSDSLLDKPMALLILQDRLSTSSLSSISSSSDFSSNSNSARDKPLPPILDADFAPPQEAKLEFESFIPIQCAKDEDEEGRIVKRNNFRQRMKRIFFKIENEQDNKHTIFDTKFRRRSAPAKLTVQPISPIKEQHPVQQDKSGVRRWRSVLNRNSISTERQASEIQAARLAQSQFTPRRRALSEDNGRLEIHMADQPDYMYGHTKDSLAQVLPTYNVFQYNRSSDRSNTCYTLNADSAFQIRDELNRYKLYEMKIHVRSRYMTHFIP
ncbi:hypothetical protein NQZ79_g4086 [Umbelopsis isabellina]|nr:hypothetical protein NQZ79_g4086 [Umbelopsis isabellina]